MFFDNDFYSLFSLFAFILIKVLSDVDTYTPTYTPPPTVDLSRLNRTVHCKFQPNGVVCSKFRKSRKFFYDVQLNRCEPFDYANCNHSYNMYDTRRKCVDACRDDAHKEVPEIYPAVVYCRYQRAFGDCNSYHPSFYFDVTDMKCKGFSYSGCGGNQNRFPNAMECQDVCGYAVSFSS